MKTNFEGLFIAFDGPNGVGKTTLISKVEKLLIEKQIDVFRTKEPTDSILGKFVHEISESVGQEALACLVAADRLTHVKKIIMPQLHLGKVVLCDRYLASSLVLQGLDGVDEEYIINIHKGIIMPDGYFILRANPKVIDQRLKKKGVLTRFERRKNIAKEESESYSHVFDILKKQDIRMFDIDTEREINKLTEEIVEIILQLVQKKV